MVRSKLMASFWLCLALVIAYDAVSFADETAEVPAARAKPHVLYLHTEFLPYKTTVDKGIAYRLGREIVRQAVLLAARDEMGLPTCDETLKETPPNNANVVEVLLVERADLHGKWNVKLTGYDSDGDPWEKTYDYTANGGTMYADMIPKLEADTRGVFREALELAGLTGEKPKSGESEAPGEEIDTLLRQVDFVAQYAAVRAAHHAIAAHGETPEWLGILVRGYANLAVLTRHQWSTATEVFTARSWLYAQRMMVATQQSKLARWHRAYAWALGGTLHHGLADLEQLEPSAEENGEPKDSDSVPETLPTWTKLIKPYCMCDRAATKQVGVQDPSLKPWATRLWFQLTSAYRVASWIHHAGEEIAEVAPTAYGVYSEMAIHGESLGTMRAGAAWGPMMFARYVPPSLGKIPGLPRSVAGVIAGSALRSDLLGGLFGSADSADAFSPVPTMVAKQLRKEAEQESQPDPSWSTLAYLLEEEQFVQIANDMVVSNYAMEHSLASAVDAVLPLVGDHRYVAYLESFRHNPRREAEKLQEVMENLELEDPRKNMSQMLVRLWHIKDAEGNAIGAVGYQNANRNFTMPGMLEYVFPGGVKQASNNLAFSRILADEFLVIAPHSDVSVRMAVTAADDPTSEQLQELENRVKDDPRTFAVLGVRYNDMGDSEGAIRCHEKSLALLPNYSSSVHLANSYFKQGDFEKWEQTLLDYLETENHGLEHARVHSRMAYGFTSRSQWQKAKPHAAAAGQTGSAWGMRVASYVSEGLAEWRESEQWVRGVSQGYPSRWGYEWYFWCRRTGRGDIESAQELAEQFFSVPPPRPKRVDLVTLGGYHRLEGDTKKCREAYRKGLAFYPSYTCAFMVAQLSRELGDTTARTEVLNATEKSALKNELAGDPASIAACLAVLELMKTEDASAERLAEIDDLLRPIDQANIAVFSYFIGMELDALGKSAEAEKYWRRSLVLPVNDPIYATLSGMQLAKRHGTSRPDYYVLSEHDVWPLKPSD